MPEPSRSYARQDIGESADVKGDRAGDDKDWDDSANDKLKYRSGKSRKQSNPEEVQEDSAARQRSSGDRKRASSLVRSGSGDEDDYESRKEMRSKQIKKTQEERPEKKLSSGHHEREPESSRRSRDASGGKGHGVDEGEWESSRRSSSNPSGHDCSQSKSRGEKDISHDGAMEKMKERDSRHTERKESGRDKGHGFREQERNQGRKRDESDSIRKREEDNYVERDDSRSQKASDVRHGNAKERINLRNELTEIKSRAVDLKDDRAIKSSNNEEKRVDGERDKSRGRSEAQEEDTRPGSIIHEDRSGGARDDTQKRLGDKPSASIDNLDSNEKANTRGQGEKNETHRHRSDSPQGVHETVESRERSVNNDEDGHARAREGNLREDKQSKRSCRPERSARRLPEPDDAVETDAERNISLKAKEREKEGLYMDGRSKGRESSWSGRNRNHESSRENWNRRHSGSNDKETIHAGDHEGSKDSWNRKQSSGNDKEAAYTGDYEGSEDNWIRRHSSGNDKETTFVGDHEGSKDNWSRRRSSSNDKEPTFSGYDFDRERNWEMQRRDRGRIDNKFNGRPGYRKFNRHEGGKSSLYGTAKGNTDSIEIRPEFHDDGREEIESIFAARQIEAIQQPDFLSATHDEQWEHPSSEDRTKTANRCGPGDDPDSSSPMLDQNSGRINVDMHGEKGRGPNGVVSSNCTTSGPSFGNGSQPLFGNNQGPGSFSRGPPQGPKGNRLGSGGRGRITGHDGQQIGIPLPMMGPPFSPLGLALGPMQSLGPNMSPAPGPPIGLFIPPFPGPNIWPGARGVDMNMLPVPPGLSRVPPGPSPSRFSPNIVAGPNPAMYFNQQGPARGVSPSIPCPGFNSMGTMGQGIPHDKAPGGWVPPRNNGPPGKAPSRGEQNDYSQNFVDTGTRPQNFIRELELTSVVEDYPKLRELIQKKDEIVAKSTTPPMYYKCDLREFVLSPGFFGTKFDVILVDPPWEEYVHRAPGVADHMEYWTFEEIMNLKIEAITDTPSFIFLWVGDGMGLDQGRQCLKKWGFRRCEDICWVKTNKTNANPGLQHDAHTLFQHSKEHCLMGIKGTVRRSTDGHIIHANIDTDIIIAEEPPYGSTTKPEDMYRIIEHFSLGRRRLELFGEDHNIRSGWLTVGKGLSSSNFNTEAYIRNFADKDGKVWQGGGGRNPPPEAPHLVLTTPDIEGLRPKSPMQKSQQQQPSTSLSTTANSVNRRPAGNSPQNHAVLGTNQEVTGSNPSTPA